MFDSIVEKIFDAMHSAAGKSDSDLEISFRISDEDGNTILDTDDPAKFAEFIRKAKEASAQQEEKKLCDHDCATCDSCGDDAEDEYDDSDYDYDCGDEEGWDDDEYDDDDWDEDDEYDEDVIFEIPVAGVAAAAALIGSVAMLIRALKKR